MTTKQQRLREFELLWTNMIGRQRSEQAKCIVEQGLRRRSLSIADLADTIKGGQITIRELVDHYWVEKGIRGGESLQASRNGIRTAMAAYLPKLDKEEVADRAAVLERTKRYDPVVARRAAQAEQVGKLLAAKGKVTDGRLTIRPVSPAEVQQIKEKHGTPVTFEEWRRRYSAYATEARAFLVFLRRTKQDIMLDGAIPDQLRNFANSFEEQVSRFDVGVAKSEARS